MNADWKRLGSVYIDETGQTAVVWIAWDRPADCVHVYDCHVHDRQVIAVQAESIKRRGKWIPVVWNLEGKEIAELLREHGCRLLPEALMKKETDMTIEAMSVDIWERMETGRFKVSEHLDKWLDEFDEFSRQDRKIPRDYPLMNATRNALPHLKLGKSYKTHLDKKYKNNYPELSIV